MYCTWNGSQFRNKLNHFGFLFINARQIIATLSAIWCVWSRAKGMSGLRAAAQMLDCRLGNWPLWRRLWRGLRRNGGGGSRAILRPGNRTGSQHFSSVTAGGGGGGLERGRQRPSWGVGGGGISKLFAGPVSNFEDYSVWRGEGDEGEGLKLVLVVSQSYF